MLKILITIMLIVCCCFSPAVPKDIDSLLKRSIGGEKAVEILQSLKNVIQFGTINMNGLIGEFRQVIELPDKYYLSVVFPDFSMEQALTDSIAWQRSMNGQVSLLSKNEKDELVKGLMLSSYGYLLPENHSVMKMYAGEQSRDGKLFEVVNLSLTADDTIQIFLDKNTGYRRYVISRHDVLSTVTKESDYREVGSIYFPFRAESDIQSANFSMVMQVDSLLLNSQIDTGLFTYPFFSEKDYHFPSNREKVTIPFEYKNGHIRVQATINGKKKVWMILDSGSATNILHLKVTEGLGLAQVGTLPGMGVGGIEDVVLLQTDSISIGELILSRQVVGALDLTGFDYIEDQGVSFGGILGYDFLSRFPVLVDYGKQELTVYDPERTVLPEGGVHIPFYLTMQIPTITAEIEGIKGEFIVDLGNALGLILLRPFVSSHKLMDKFTEVSHSDQLIGGIGGSVSGYSAVAKKFKIGQLVMENLEVIIPEISGGITASEDIDGNIGNMVLDDFSILFNYQSREIILYQK